MKVAVNARVTRFAMGGQQRVTAEILNRLGSVVEVAPRSPLGGVKGHVWEQGVLPFRTLGQLLWSPSATGPIVKAHQVVTLHDVAFLDVPECFSKQFALFYKALMPILVHRVARVVTVSEFSRQRIIECFGLEPARVDVIENGVSANFRPYSAAEIELTRRELALPARYLLLQATADKRKNLRGAMEAWTRAQKHVPDDVTLVVSGHLGRAHVFGDLGPIQDVPRTKLLGFIDERHMGPLMAGAEAFLFPSLYEGFGLPIIEAMACGTPVLTADATATREVAADAAVLVDPASVQEMSDGIIRLVESADLRTSLVQKGLKRAADFTWDNAAAKYRTLFRSLGGEL